MHNRETSYLFSTSIHSLVTICLQLVYPVWRTFFQGSPSEELNDLHISPTEVDGFLGKLRDDKAAGADDILPKLLREVGKEIAYPIGCNFRKSLDEGVIPDDWKVLCKIL